MKSVYPVQGMSCASCALSVESTLKSVKGVQNAAVNFGNQTVVVEYDLALVAPAAFRVALEEIGYGVTLEADKDEDSTASSNKRKWESFGSLALSVPVGMIGMFFMDLPFANVTMLILTTPVIFWFGSPFFLSAWKKGRHGQVNMDTLVALSAGTAFLFSIFNTVFPAYWHIKGLHAPIYYEAATFVISFVSLGKWLEESARAHTAKSIRHLLKLQPKTVFVRRSIGKEEEIAIEQVEKGDILRARPGESIAVDGKVVEGTSFVDESSMSGEAVPVLKTNGDAVLAGTINQQGVLYYLAEKIGKETLLAQIIQKVQEAQGSKAPVQKLVDKVAAVFVPIVLACALVTLVIWMFSGVENAFAHGLMASLTVLVIACPCALGLATPTALIVGIGKGAEQHIIIKDAACLEKAAQVDTVVLDKTGTITLGNPTVTQVSWQVPESEVVPYLYTIEALSVHPLAKSVVAYLEAQHPTKVSFDRYESFPGRGEKMSIGSDVYRIGSPTWAENENVVIRKDCRRLAAEWTSNANTVVYFSKGENILAVLAFSDPVKQDARAAISALHQSGIEIWMLTGDDETTAKTVAQQVGIDHIKAKLLPDDKAAHIQQLQAQGKTVAMVGDGINDSPALAQADASMAMGQGADIALEISDITLMTSQIAAVPQLLHLAKRTFSTIRQNLFWAFVYNVIGIPVAAGVLYPAFGILLNPMWASVAMVASSLSVVGNSLRLRNTLLT